MMNSLLTLQERIQKIFDDNKEVSSEACDKIRKSNGQLHKALTKRNESAIVSGAGGGNTSK